MTRRRPYMTANELARVSGLPLDWLKTEAKRGTLPHLKIGNRVVFNADRVEEAIRQREQGGASLHTCPVPTTA